MDNIYSRAEEKQRQINFALPRPTRMNEFTKEQTKKLICAAKRSGQTLDFCKRKAIEDEVFWRLMVLPEPGRQGVHEKALFDYVFAKVRRLKNTLKILPKTGKKACWLYDGKIVTENPNPGNEKKLKTLDFFAEIKVNGKITKVYFICKYTNEPGGSQDNQFAEVRNNLKHCTKDQDFLVMVVLDGGYYGKYSKKFGMTPIVGLEDEYSEFPNVIISRYININSKLDEWVKGKK